MVLRLLPLLAGDFPRILHDAKDCDPGDDLVGPQMPICWPVITREDAEMRLQVNMEQQLQRLTNDSSTNYLKIVDVSDSIIAIARWHWYPNGYSFNQEAHWEQFPEPSPPKPWARQYNIALNNFMLGSRDAAREGWMGVGQPCLILMHLVTRPSQRGRGAARLLIQWGIEQAEKWKVPAYLEAGVMGRPIYEKMGFRQVGELAEVDLKPFGVDTTFILVRMVYGSEYRKDVNKGRSTQIHRDVDKLLDAEQMSKT